LYPAGSKDVPLGKVLAILVEEEGDIAAFKDYVATDSAPAAPAKAAEPTPAAAAPTPAQAAPVS
jgi:pyruvate dehydrogenase E2 component (dihydrolipoamide acetyltransferase)